MCPSRIARTIPCYQRKDRHHAPTSQVRSNCRCRALLLGALLASGFAVGLWIGRRSQAAVPNPPINREVSQKAWVTGQELKDRFPAAKHAEFMCKAIANSRMAGVEKHTGGALARSSSTVTGRSSPRARTTSLPTSIPPGMARWRRCAVACGKLKVLKLDGCILYTSAEPCPMCMATAYWAGIDGIIYGATVGDAKQYGGFDDAFIYEQFLKPAGSRNIPEIQMLREEAVKVWKEYASQSNNVPY